MSRKSIDDGLTATQRYRMSDKYKDRIKAIHATEEFKQKQREYVKKYREKHKERLDAIRRSDDFKNKRKSQRKPIPEEDVINRRKRSKEHYELNKECILKKCKERYYLQDADKRLEKSRRRRSMLSFATPAWANKELIKDIYSSRGNFHVDHIIPIRGKNVCGLHCASNLQYMSPKDNKSKKNKFNQDGLQSICESMHIDKPLSNIAFKAVLRGII